MSKVEVGDITLRQELHGDVIAVYANHDWPKRVLMAPEVLRGTKVITIVAGEVKITCENGFAFYRLAEEQLGFEYCVTLDLVRGFFREPPSEKPSTQPKGDLQ